MLDAKFKAQIGQLVGRTFPAAELVDVQQLTAGASQQTFRVSVRQREGHEAHYALRRAQPGLERTTYGQVTPSVEAELLELCATPGSLSEDELIERYAQMSEEAIRLQPESYLWSNRRWKLKPPQATRETPPDDLDVVQPNP